MKYTTLISTAELASLLGDPSLVIVDCGHNLMDVGAGERAYRAEHLPGAQFMHMDRDLAGPKTGANGRHPLPDISSFTAMLGRAGIDAGKQVVAYDQNSGMWASRLWWLLRWLGHDAVAVLDGGRDRWVAERRPVTALTTTPAETTFEPATGPTASMTASATDILRDIEAPARSIVVLDARAPERYRGDLEPIDPVAGHIPGARNRPYTENLTDSAVFKSAAALRREFLSLLGGVAATSVVHQCGSGVTSCHNLLAMEISGLPGSKLFPGSWSEWVADPTRPVERSP